jgi:phosphate transport system substrate-binding protein
MSMASPHGSRLACWIGPLLVASSLSTSPGLAEDLRGTLTVVGRGPERPVIKKLARAFEKAHVGTAVDLRWSRNLRITDVVRSGEADLAVSGSEEPDLTATTIAWDGLAVVVNFSNPIRAVAMRQVASLFSGDIRDWSQVDERASGNVHVVLRPEDQNLNEGFERSLGLAGAVTETAERIRSDQKVLSRVSGQLDAVSYLSLKAALQAATYGMSVRVLLVDGVEAGTPTVQSRQYPLKRPVVLLAGRQPTKLAQAFVEFALSPPGQRLLAEMFVPRR